MMVVLVLFAVHLHHGGRQAGAGAEVGWQGDPVCPGNQGRQDGDGERRKISARGFCTCKEAFLTFDLQKGLVRETTC